MKTLKLVLCSMVLFPLTGLAIVVSDYSVATNTPTGEYDLNWEMVHKYKNSSAVAVGSNWLLTAAHVADDGGSGTVLVGGTNYYQQEIIFHSAAYDPEHVNKADLALVRFDKTFPDYCPLYTGPFPTINPQKLSAVIVGYGTTGTVYSTYYTTVAWNDPSSGVRRWGSQRIDGPHNGVNYDVGGTTGMTYNDGIQMQFSLGDTAYEAGVGTYDSGGGSFVKDGGVWKLAGINTVQYGGPTDFTGTFAVSMPAYEMWATNVMNELGDLDGDGIPNYWEQRYGSTTGLVVSVDNDSDGFTNEDEWFADTDPTDSNQFWEVDATFIPTNQTFTFDGSTARKYLLLYTTNDLVDPGLTWVSNGVPVWGEGEGTEIVTTNTEDSVFYRVRVTLP